MTAGKPALEAGQETDEELMLAYAQGEAAAFDCLYSRHKLAVYRFFARQGLPAAVAEELSHDTWLRIIKAREAYEVTALFKTWLFTIARNLLIDHQQKKANRMELVSDGTSENSPLNEVSFNESRNNSNENDINREQLAARLREQIALLPLDQRETFLLKQEAGFTIDEIAGITHQNREKVKSSWRYAIQKLRRGLNHYVNE